eukprot:Gb_24312 [translate_table: standard]
MIGQDSLALKFREISFHESECKAIQRDYDKPIKVVDGLNINVMYFYCCCPMPRQGLSNVDAQSVRVEYSATYCSINDIYEKNSAYEKNLEAALESIVNNASVNMFKSSTHGQGSDRVFTLFNCRGDLSLGECSRCISLAKNQILQRCNGTKGAELSVDGCYLRYNSSDFSNQIDMLGAVVYSTQSVSIQKDNFRKTLEPFLINLIQGVANSKGLYSINSTTTPDSDQIYAIAQCRRDVADALCVKCLQDSVAVIIALPTYIGGRVDRGSCYLRFENNPSFLAIGAKDMLTIPTSSFPGISPSTKDIAESPYVNRRGPVLFTYEELNTAAQNFHSDNKLGEGGYGSVYKGNLQDGREVAIKKLSVASKRGKQQFVNEVGLITSVQHRNLVRLIGCSVEGAETLLVYEYLPNRSLDKFLFDPQKAKLLNWPARLNIIVGAARGLAYLHEDSQVRIIHRDIKASNVLLDDKLNAKIADFGFARLFAEEASHVSTRVAGTFGYMAPEYAMHGHLTEKADVFSFGVLVLEVVAGRKSIDMNESSPRRFLLEWAWMLHEEGDLLDLMDPRLDREAFSSEVTNVIQVALLCTQAAASLRPAMSRVLLMLSSDLEIEIRPTKPAFVEWTQLDSMRNGKRDEELEPIVDSPSIIGADLSYASSR